MMGKETIEILVEGGNATAAPPLGPSIAPLKINVQKVVDKINEKTKSMAGMKVPVKVILDTETKEFEINVGKPPASALIKKELGLEKGAKEPGITRVADLSEEQVKKIAMIKFGADGPGEVSQIKGTASSMGVTVGKGKVTEEERSKYEQIEKMHEEELAAKETAHETEAGAPKGAGEAVQAGESDKAKEGKEKPSEQPKV